MKILALLLSLLLLVHQPARAAEITMPEAPGVDAKAWLLYDYSSNQILTQSHGRDRMEPASLTKLMTAYLTFKALRERKLDIKQQVKPSTNAVQTQEAESRMFLMEDTPVSVDDLLHGLIIQSGNDAARTLAEAVAGNEPAFVALMNKEAARLGLKDTHYMNATGLPAPEHYSSAYDLALLGGAIVRDFPEYYPLYAIRDFQYNGITQANRNRLLWLDPFVDGMKTGHTERAGFCLVASAKRGERRLISVVLGAGSDDKRASESQKLLNHGFQDYDSLPLYKKGQQVTTLRTWKGTLKMLPIGPAQDISVAIPHGMQSKVKATVELQHPLLAPVGRGQRVGTLKISVAGIPYTEYPLVALQAVPMANVFSRGWDTIRLFFE